MTSGTITVTLEGEITLQGFTDALRKLEMLLSALVTDIAAVPSIDWLITDLRGGSAAVTLSGQAEQEEECERVAGALVTVLRALRDRRPVPYAPRVVRRAHDLEAAITGSIMALHIETEGDAVALHRQGSVGEVAFLGAYGAVEGRIETLTSRRDLRFTLFDTVFDRGVTCALTEERRDLLRDAWGQRAIVEGWVSRDPFSGRPVAIQNIAAIEILEERPTGAQQWVGGALGQSEAEARLAGLRRGKSHAF